ncbi:MAG: hypothetical protein EPN99_17175, partial [Frankiales bacterium]
MLSLKKKSAVLALALALPLTLAACGSDDEATTGSSTTQDQTEPTPAAAIDTLTGKQTAVTLDTGFLEGLTALKLTPATLGGAKLEGAVI